MRGKTKPRRIYRRLAQPLAQRLDTKDRAEIALGVVGALSEDNAEQLLHARLQVARMPGSIDEQTMARPVNRVAARRCRERQPFVASQHPGRADWQRIERLRLARHHPLARRELNVEPPKRDTECSVSSKAGRRRTSPSPS
jgi:hypothetical protein